MPNIAMNATDRQQMAWHMRQTLGWPVERIARRLGVQPVAVRRLLLRAARHNARRAQPPPEYVIRRRLIRTISLSAVPAGTC